MLVASHAHDRCARHFDGDDLLPQLCVVPPGPESMPRQRLPLTEPVPGRAWDDFDGNTLRLALAMRGGVSLAVWIGGAVAEIDFARSVRAFAEPRNLQEQAAPPLAAPQVAGVLFWQDANPSVTITRRARLYALMLARARFNRIDPDVLAGASAGGLNSILFAAAQREGRPATAAKALWEQSGGIARLLRAPGPKSVESLLDGRYFFEQLRQALAGASVSHPDLRQDFITVDLAATILDGQDAGQQSIRDGRGGFHFRADDGRAVYRRSPLGQWTLTRKDAGNGIATTGASREDRQISRRRLALAARTTSSFPGAFESVPITSRVCEDITRLPSGPWPDDEAHAGAMETDAYWHGVDESAAFLAHHPSSELRGKETFRVVDGGVLDNIPIERAIRAIGPRSSPHPTSRHLTYLDPCPPNRPVAPAKDRRRDSTLLAVVRSVRRTQKPNERESSDVDEIHDRITALYLDEGAFSALAATGGPRWDQTAVSDRRAAYVRDRAPRDSELIARVLDDPAGWQLASSVAPRWVWAVPDRQSTWFKRMRFELNTALDQRAAVAATANQVCADARAAADAAACVLAGVRFLETTAIRAVDGAVLDAALDRKAISRARMNAYTAHGLALGAVDRRLFDLLVFTEPCARLHATRTPANSNAGIPELLELVRRWVDAEDFRVQYQLDPWGPLQRAWETVKGQFVIIDSLLSPQTLVGGMDVDASPGGDGVAGDTVERRWNERPWKYAVGAENVRDLAPYLVPAGIPAIEGYPTYTRIDADARPADLTEQQGPLHVAFVTLERWDRERLVAKALAGAVPSADSSGETGRQLRAQTILERFETGVLPAGAKLGGSQLANFSGFLSTEWRTNDWWWGRIDAAAGVARMLRSTDDEALQREIAQEADTPLHAGAGGLARLRGNYRYAIAASLARLGERAIRGAHTWHKIASQALFVLLRPFFLALPLAIDLPRLVAVVGVIVAATTFIGASGMGGTRYSVAAILVSGALLIVIAAVLIARGADARARWRAVGEAVNSSPSPANLIELNVYQWRRRDVAGWMVLAVAATAVAGFAVAGGAIGAAVVWAAVAAAMATMADMRMRSVRGGIVGRERRGIAWPSTVAAVIGAGFLIARVSGMEWLMVLDLSALRANTVWLAAFLWIGILLCARWLHPAWAIALPVLAAATLWVIVLLVAPGWPDGLGWWLGITAWANILWVLPQLLRFKLSDEAQNDTLLPLRGV